MKTKKSKPAVSPLAYKLILSAGITLLLISIHYSYFSPAGYGDWMLGALAALINCLIWGLRAPWDKLAGGLCALLYFLYIAGQSLYYRLFGQYIFLSTAVGLRSEATQNLGAGFSAVLPQDWRFRADRDLSAFNAAAAAAQARRSPAEQACPRRFGLPELVSGLQLHFLRQALRRGSR